MATDTSVKFFHSAMTGAPVLTGQAGSLIALLDACLVNGFGQGNVDGIVIAGGVATVTRSAGHSFEVGTVALIAGATVTGGVINGEHRVTAVTTTTYQFDATGIANQVATGAFTHKVAPLGWTKVFANTNLAVYKSSDPAATGCLLRVDDTGATSARAVAYEAMSDISTGTGQFPTTAQVNGGIYWPKSQQSNATSRAWMLFGDGRLFFSSHNWNLGGVSLATPICFGDPVALKSPDPYACFLVGPSGDIVSSSPGSSTADLAYAGNGLSATAARGYTGLGSAATMSLRPSGIWNVFANIFSGGGGHPFPNPTDGGLYTAPMFAVEGASLAIRAQLPGFLFVPQLVGSSTFAVRDSVVGTGAMAGRLLKAIPNGVGAAFFDATGPWR